MTLEHLGRALSNLILFGFKGAGKTSFGKQLANLLQWPFIDTDERMLSASGGSTIRELYLALGETRFRFLETEVIRALVGTKRSVIALGGGSVLDPANVALLQPLGQFVYLDVDLETLQRRGVSLAVGDLETVYWKRRSVYESIPAHKVNVAMLEAYGL